jgi:protein involved in polysaccharide export with SLBB domain
MALVRQCWHDVLRCLAGTLDRIVTKSSLGRQSVASLPRLLLRSHHTLRILRNVLHTNQPWPVSRSGALVSPRISRALLGGVALLLLSGCLPRRPDFLIRTERATVPMVDGTRAQLAERVAELEQGMNDGSLRGGARTEAVGDLASLRARLESGDFQVGDQIIVTVSQDLVQVDTATVRDGLVIAFAALPDVSVAGLLRSELLPRLQAHVDRFRKEHTVRVNLLTRLLITGQVARPGYYSISPDRPATEIIMLAGGPTPFGKLEQVTVRRDRRLIVKGSQWRNAVRAGTTVATLGVQPGDEVIIGGRPPSNALQSMRGFAFAASGVFAVIRLLQFIYTEPE